MADVKDELDIVNWEKGYHHFKDDKKAYAEYLTHFSSKDVHNYIRRLHNAIKHDDWETTQKIVQEFAEASNKVGAERLYDSCATLKRELEVVIELLKLKKHEDVSRESKNQIKYGLVSILNKTKEFLAYMAKVKESPISVREFDEYIDKLLDEISIPTPESEAERCLIF